MISPRWNSIRSTTCSRIGSFQGAFSGAVKRGSASRGCPGAHSSALRVCQAGGCSSAEPASQRRSPAAGSIHSPSASSPGQISATSPGGKSTM